MKTNLGGQIAPEDVIGRDELIVRMWKVLEKQSVVLTAERRIGKTQLVKKICATPIKNKLMVYRDLERVETLEDLAKLLLDTCGELVTIGTRAKTKAHEVLESLSGMKIDHVGTLPTLPGPSWVKVIEAILQDLAESNQPIIFFWDEFPWMIQEIIKRDGAVAATDLLDLLRAVRQESNNLRFVITGSIGLRHVLDDLKVQAGYHNPAFNDMHLIEVPPLGDDHARLLAQRLLSGEGVELAANNDVPGAIAKAAGNVPYYIHHLVDQLSLLKKPADELAVESAVKEALTAANDPWNLKHFHERIESYFGVNDGPVVRGLLDIFATNDKPLSINEAYDLAQAGGPLDREALIKLLDKLTGDHYLVRGTDGQFKFRYALIARWWRLYRGL